MEVIEDIVIVGGGLAGLATALGLHRKGVRSLVLESSDSLRSAGFAFSTWANAWRALDALGVADELRRHHLRLQELALYSPSSGEVGAKIPFNANEIRCLKRELLLETLAKELPSDTIRYSSKVVSIEESDDNTKILQLVDGSTLKTKVLIGCDGVNSVVSKWLGLKKPSFAGRSAIRAFAEFPDGHGFDADFFQFFGVGCKAGILPCDEKTLYWFFTWSPSLKEKKIEDVMEIKQLVITKFKEAKVPQRFIQVIEKSDINGMLSSPLRFRFPLELLYGNTCSKSNVTVAGDAFHPMTPDLGQGGCSALEDAVVLARCLSEALKGDNNGGGDAKEEHVRVRLGLEKYVKERKWRGFDLITTSYILGRLQQTESAFVRFLREKVLAGILGRAMVKRSSYDCGKL